MNNKSLNFRTATRQQLECIWSAISAETGDDRFFTTKELDILPRELAEDEQVLSFSSGFVDGKTWLIVLTDQRIMLLNKGIFFGLRQVSIEIYRINSFESKTGLIFGSIEIGSNARNYSITNVWKKTVNPFTMKLREAQRAYDERKQLYSPGTEQALQLECMDSNNQTLSISSTPAPLTLAAPPSVLIEPAIIREVGDSDWLERLRAAGAINAQEYEAYKS